MKNRNSLDALTQFLNHEGFQVLLHKSKQDLSARASAIACALHGKDELDLVFSDGRFLYVCECKDRTVGQNDIYVLAMKASRISADRKMRVTVDRVLIISTEPISKDVMPDERTEESRGEIEYIAIGGGAFTHKGKVIKDHR